MMRFKKQEKKLNGSVLNIPALNYFWLGKLVCLVSVSSKLLTQLCIQGPRGNKFKIQASCGTREIVQP